MSWRSYSAQPDSRRSPRSAALDEPDVECSFCGRKRHTVAAMTAQPVRRRWSDTGEVDEGEDLVCDVCQARAEHNRTHGRRCELCGSAVNDGEFVNLGYSATICLLCTTAMHGPDANWKPREGSCFHCGRDLIDAPGWSRVEGSSLLCRECAPPAGLFDTPAADA